jgi:hypothetical protein
MRRPRLRLGILVLVLLLLASSLAFYPVRRRVVVAYLHLGDWLAPSPPRRELRGELLVFDATESEDRRAFGRGHGHGQLAWKDQASALELRAAGLPGEHEVCTRRIPRDWAPFSVLRLELDGASGGRSRQSSRPLHLTLRVRSRPGWGHTAWYWQRVFLDGTARSWEVGLAHADRFIDRRGVRQVCLSLRTEPGATTPTLRLHRILLADRFSVERPPPGRPSPLRVVLLSDGHKPRRFDELPAPDASRFRLHSARNEVVGLQLAIRSPRPAGASITFEPFSGPAGPRPKVRILRARYLTVRETSTSMYGTGLGPPGHYPDPLEPLDGSPIVLRLGTGNQLFWLDVTVPEDAAPGRYRSTLSIVLDGVPAAIERILELEIWPVTLPHRRKLVMIYYLPALLRQASSLAEGAEGLRLELEAHRLVHAHGAYLAATPALAKLPRYKPAIDGSLFTEEPGRGEGAPYWPIDLMAEGPEETARAALQASRWFAANAPATVPFVYLADEPSTRADYESIALRARQLKAVPPPGNRLGVMITEREKHEGQAGWPDLRGLVDIWISPLNFPEPARSRRGGHERFFTYNGVEPLAGSHLLDADGTSLRTWGWIAYLHGIDLWFLWQGAYYQDIYNGGAKLQPLHDAVSFDKRRNGRGEDFGNGDGVIFYPPLHPGAPPLGSLRLKAIRRGVQDRLLLQLASRCGRGHHARRIARGMVPASLGEALQGTTGWPRAPERWERARLELLRLVAGCP